MWYRRTQMTRRLKLLAGLLLACRLVPGQGPEQGPQPKTTAGSKSAGVPARGQQIYATKGGCAKCHAINGHGGAVGPDLTGIGDRRETAELRIALIEPRASARLEFLQVRIVTNDGHSLTGVRINEDAFSIQIRDLSSQFHSFWKNELSEILKEPKLSLMPSYRSILSTAELDDLLAYLQSLQGRP